MTMIEQTQRFQAYYAQTFPDRANPVVNSLLSINNGWESDVYRFQVSWGSEGDRINEHQILRIYPGIDAREKSTREYQALRMLLSAGYPVPRVEVLEQADSPFGKPFIIMEYIEGQGMWGPMFTHPCKEEQQRLLSLFCHLFARLHALDWRKLAIEPPASYEAHPNTVIAKQLDRWQPFVEAAPLPGFLPGWNWLRTRSHDIECDGPSPVHWDFHPDNILLRPPGSTGEEAVVIDWTHLEISDYRFDLAWTLLLAIREGPLWRKRFLREYEQQSGKIVRDLAFFEVAACFRRLYSVMFALDYGAEQIGMRPGAEEQMRRQAINLRSVYERSLEITHLHIQEVELFLESLKA